MQDLFNCDWNGALPQAPFQHHLNLGLGQHPNSIFLDFVSKMKSALRPSLFTLLFFLKMP
jgi:hypothetical protein